MGIGEFLGRVTKYPQSVQGMIWDQLLQQLNETDEGLAQCESPIEQMLYLPLNELANSLINNEYASCASVLPQYPIECGGKKFRVDFLFQVLLKDDYCMKFVIECDGHEFHEKTKEQVRKDKQRERYLMSDNHTLIRFAGSEVYKDPYRCAEEVEDIIGEKIRTHHQHITQVIKCQDR